MSSLLFLIYFSFFSYLIFKIKLEKYKFFNRKYLLSIFIIKIAVGISLNFLYSNYYKEKGKADIYKYYDDSKFIYNSLWENPQHFFQLISGYKNDDIDLNIYLDSTMNWKYQTSNFKEITNTSNITLSNHRTVTKFNALVRIFSFGNINIHVLFMSFISLLGCLLIFKAYYKFIDETNLKLFIPIVFLTPSVLVWSSGILKEGLIIFGFGVFIYAMVNLSKNIYKYIFWIALSILLISFTKYYLVLILIPPTILYLTPFKSKILIVLKYSLFILSFLFVFNSFNSVSTLLFEKIKTKRSEQIRTSIGGFYYIQINKDNFQRIVRFEEELNTIGSSSDPKNNSLFLNAEKGLKYQVYDGGLNKEFLKTNSKYRYYFLDAFNKAGSYYILPELNETTLGLTNSSFKALINVFSKPFNFLKGSLLLRLGSLENLIIICLICFLFFKRKLKISNLNLLLFNILFISLLYVVIGLTIPVIGGLVRYKMMGLLLLLISLLMTFKEKKTEY